MHMYCSLLVQFFLFPAALFDLTLDNYDSQVKPVADDEMFKVLRSGKRKNKAWKRMVTKVTAWIVEQIDTNPNASPRVSTDSAVSAYRGVPYGRHFFSLHISPRAREAIFLKEALQLYSYIPTSESHDLTKEGGVCQMETREACY